MCASCTIFFRSAIIRPLCEDVCVEYHPLYHGTKIEANKKAEFCIIFYIISADFADYSDIFK